jgi:hypothetical protein
MHFKKEEKYNNLGYNSNQLNKLVLFESYEKRFKKKRGNNNKWKNIY